MKNYQFFEINPNPNWPYISGDPYGILIIGDLRSRKTNVLLNLIKHQPDIDKIYTSKIQLNQSINCSLIEEKK